MATESLNNPFSGYGSIVFGDKFMGRSECLRQINQRVLGENFGNLAIIGLPRIGKSSLAWQGIMLPHDDLINKRCIPVFMEVGSCCDSSDFFSRLIELSFEEVEINFQGSRSFPLLLKCVENLKQEYSTDQVQKYFRILKREKIKSIFILDEFDRVRSFFTVADFQLLRELSYNPNTKICLVPTARKNIADIEAIDGGISNLHGTFSTIHLSVFSENDKLLYWDYYQKEFPTDNSYQFFVNYLSGGHPWLMDIINSRMFLGGGDRTNINVLIEEMGLELMDTLDTVVHTLGEENLLNDAVQLVLGPYFKVDQKNEERLLKYGFIRRVKSEYKRALFNNMSVGPVFENEAYLCYSDYGTLDLYRRYYANVPYASEWSETENLLRTLIKSVLANKYGDDWFGGMRSELSINKPWTSFNLSKWEANVSSLRNSKNDMISKFPSMSEGHDVEFTLTAQIFDIFIRPMQAWFNQHVFKGNWRDWNNKFEYLTKLRNPIAHNNNSGSLDEEVRIASEYCKEINLAIREWQKTLLETVDES